MSCKCRSCLIPLGLIIFIVVSYSCTETPSVPDSPQHEPSWNTVGFPTSYDLNDAWGENDNCIFTVGNSGTILRFNGSEWKPMTAAWNNYLGIWGSSSSSIYAIGYDNPRAVHYDGDEWIALEDFGRLRSIWGSSGKAVYAVGGSGEVKFYNGTSWQTIKSPTLRNLYGVWGSAENNVYMVGELGLIFNYTGTAWKPMSSGDAQCLIPVDAATIILTEDSRWLESICRVQCQERIYLFLFEYDLRELSSLPASAIHVATIDIEYSRYPEFGPGTKMMLYCYYDTADGEIKVEETTSGTFHSDIICVPYYSGKVYIDVLEAVRTAINDSRDFIGFRVECYDYYGYTLESCPPSMIINLEPTLTSIWGSSKDDIYAVGSSGTIVHYDGQNWIKMDSGTIYDLNDIYGFSAGEIFAVGDNGKIIHYDGKAWEGMESGTTNDLHAVWGMWPTNIYAFGEDGLILRYR
ncbi:MAG: hypothetical protein JXB45_13020 [Candidatus Krumholzibacteriota bacterium]|nr:hypothetical protein [Candidatus Krumholzibacteriota bacterium]